MSHTTPHSIPEQVVANPYALGVTLYSQRGALTPLAISGPCGHSIAPTMQSLKSEDYPLTLPHYLHLPRWRLQPGLSEALHPSKPPSLTENTMKRKTNVQAGADLIWAG